MQAREATELRKKWGKKPCPHPTLDKEYDLGADTGDYVCMICGEVFTRKEREEIQRKQNLSNST